MDNGEELDLYYFKRKPEEYKRTLDPVKDYIKQATTYISKREGISKEEANSKVKLALKKANLKNPIVRFNSRQKNGDLREEKVKMTEYLKDVIENNEMMAPSLTSYVNPSELQSIHGEFLNYNVKERSRYKKLAFKEKQAGNLEQYEFNNTLQKTKKVFNNSLSGAYASASTILYNPSSHSTLTSMTRCVASIGNSISESIISGNKHLRTPELVYNYITAIIDNVNMELVKYCIEKYNLYTPNVTDVMDMFLKSTHYYWKDISIEEDLKDYLSKLEGYELAAILYVNDMYHIRKHNDVFVRQMLTELKESKTGLTSDVKYLTKSAEGVEILSKIINGDLIKGMSVNYDELQGTDILDTLASTAMNICNVLNKYKRFFKTFLTTDVLPISIAYIKDMLRECIVLSDTDSTCGSYGEWVEWYYGESKFDQDAIALSAAIMTINTQAMDHNIKIFARNMNVEGDKVELLKMKNEFYWSSFTPSNASKHYYANTCIQEGNVFKDPDLELKGAHFIGSSVSQEVVKTIHGYIKEVNDLLYRGKSIDISYYIKGIADLERLVIKKIQEGDISVFSKNTIKDPKGYKQSQDESVYWNHILWEKVFAEKYGSPGKPPYMFIKIPTTLGSPAKLSKFIETIEDEDIKDKFQKEMERVGKKMFGTFRPPMLICSSNGIPEEFKSVIDYNRVVEDNLKSGYFFLETLGFYKKKGRLIYEMGY